MVSQVHPKERSASVLVIGHSLDVYAECVEWDSPEPNVADYDVVIMDLTTAQTVRVLPLGTSVQSRFQVDASKYLHWPQIRRTVGRQLLSCGQLFVVANPEIVIHPDAPAASLHDARRTALLPFVPFGEKVPAGQSITWVDPRFDFYFREVEQWNFVFTGGLDEHFYEHLNEKVMCQVRPLAKNRADEILALSVSVAGNRSREAGMVYLLPPPTRIASSEAIQLLLAHLDDLWEFPEEGGRRVASEFRLSGVLAKRTIASRPTASSSTPLPSSGREERAMLGIPIAIYSRLREALLDCGPFEDDRQLKAVFAHPKLRPWRHSVPQASDPSARVDAAIAFLAEKRRADTGENALVLLLRVLSERIDPADECHPRLVRLAGELEHALGGSLPAGHTSPPTSTPSFPPVSLDEEVIAEIEKLVQEDQLAEALGKLSSIEAYRQDATLLTRRLSSIRQQERRGTIIRGDAAVEYTRIAQAILALISS